MLGFPDSSNITRNAMNHAGCHSWSTLQRWKNIHLAEIPLRERRPPSPLPSRRKTQCAHHQPDSSPNNHQCVHHTTRHLTGRQNAVHGALLNEEIGCWVPVLPVRIAAEIRAAPDPSPLRRVKTQLAPFCRGISETRPAARP